MYEIINLKFSENELIHIRYIKDDITCINAVSSVEHSKGGIKYKEFKYSTSYSNPVDCVCDTYDIRDDIKHVYDEIIKKFIASSATDLFDDVADKSYDKFCLGGFINMKYIIENYNVSAKTSKIYRLLHIIDSLYPFKEVRNVTNFSNLKFYSKIVEH